MAQKTLQTRLKLKKDTAANWESKNPVLLDGEQIFIITAAGETRVKVGDGTKTYTQLPFTDEPLRTLISTKESSSEVTTKLATKADKTTTITADNGLTGGGDLSANITISHADTSSVSNVTANGRKYVTGLTFDDYGHVTNVTTGTETVTNTDTKVTQTLTSSNASYPLLLAPSGQTANATTTSYFDSGVTLNPSTNTIAANISGNASTATALTSSAGSATQPVYFSDGKPITTTYTLEKSVPSDAKFTDTTYSDMTGATSSAAGTHGLVPAPASGKQTSYLRGDGTWAVPTNTTYAAGTGLSLSGTTFNHSNSVTAGTAQGDASKTLTFGGTFTIPTVTYDAQGHITGKGTTIMTMPSNPNSDTKVNVTLGTTTKAYLLGTSTTPTSTAAGVTAIADTGVYLDTTAGKLTAGSFAGNGASLTSLNASNISSGTIAAARLPVATSSNIGGVKSGTDITVDSSGNVSVNNDSHTHSDSTITSLDASKLTGTIPSSILPSYVDDVIECNNLDSFPITGETGKIYVDLSTNLTYRWSGTQYVEISPSLALGTTSSTAFRGDYGNTAYTHATEKGSAFSSGLYKITTNTQGHVTAATAVTKNDITGLGIPGEKTTISVTQNLTSGSEIGTINIDGVETNLFAPDNNVYGVHDGDGNVTILIGDAQEEATTITAEMIGAAAIDHTHNAMVGASSSSSGTAGFVPAPAAGEQNSFLRGDGTWQTVNMSVMTGATTSSNGSSGLVPAPSSGSANRFLRSDATWQEIEIPELNYLPLTGGTVTGNVVISSTTASTSTTTGALTVSGGVGVAGDLYASNVIGAVWNDYAETRKVYTKEADDIFAGKVVTECKDENDTVRLTTKRLEKIPMVVTDTYGFLIGEKEGIVAPIAVAGRVLVYTNEDRDSYELGDAVCSAPNGTISKMTEEEIRMYPDRILGYVSCIPNYDVWGKDTKVNNRIWIKLR